MKTAAELLREQGEGILADIALLLDRSSLRHMSRDWGNAVWLGRTGEWGDLDTEARRLQSKVIAEYGGYHATMSVILRGQPPDAAREFEDADRTIREVVEQSDLTHIETVDAAREEVRQAFTTLKALLDRLHDAGGGDVYVPDTNALLYNLDLDQWTFPGSPAFELVLTPTVLVELDELKVNHRNPDVREKAEGMIRRIKGYRTRGRLTEGVPLRASVSTIRTIGQEPRMAESLPWLDETNRDDRFIASVVDVIRTRPRSAVVIVTRDINLQNKAEMATLPFVEPPDPTAPDAA